METYDVIIVGGGPAGLSASLALGRARRRVLLCDAGPRRNAAAAHIQNFVTRDGTPPDEFRRLAREELERYPGVEAREDPVEEIRAEPGAFRIRLASGTVRARRVLLCTGMIDEVPEIDGLRALWGTSVFICPYCHGWEVQDRAFGFLALDGSMLEGALLFRSWTSDLVVLTDGKYEVPAEARALLDRAGVGIDERRLVRLSARDGRLDRVEFAEGSPRRMDVLFLRPPQRQVPLVSSLGLALDRMGYVAVDEATRETSIPGIFAGGDLVTPVQSAVLAAASGMLAAARLNHTLMIELAAGGGPA